MNRSRGIGRPTTEHQQALFSIAREVLIHEPFKTIAGKIKDTSLKMPSRLSLIATLGNHSLSPLFVPTFWTKTATSDSSTISFQAVPPPNGSLRTAVNKSTTTSGETTLKRDCVHPMTSA
ncbi:MAG: hypothetical protein P8M80_17165 [Pirellulaceae bacterium]|nr:hypothetical protein [Pirellulaceae bacterium]